MKYFIIGLHSSGKQEVVDVLEKLGVRCGKLFSNIDSPSEEVYNSHNYELYNSTDINEIFENKAYVFMNELESKGNINAYKYYEGLSLYSFDNNDVFVLSPDQLISIPSKFLDDNDICYVWMDGNRFSRLNRYYSEKRTYSFADREMLERQFDADFVKTMYSNNRKKIYFNAEDPRRVAIVLYTLIKDPDLLDLYTKFFN